MFSSLFIGQKPARQQHPPGSTMPPKVAQNATSSVVWDAYFHIRGPIVGGKGVFLFFLLVNEWLMLSWLAFDIHLHYSRNLLQYRFQWLELSDVVIIRGIPWLNSANQHQESLTQMVLAISNCLNKKHNGKSDYAGCSSMKNYIVLREYHWHFGTTKSTGVSA